MPQFVLAAVNLNGATLVYASTALKADIEIVQIAVSDCWHALQYASEQLRSDRKLVLDAVKQSGLALGHASSALRADRAVVLAAVHQVRIERPHRRAHHSHGAIGARRSADSEFCRQVWFALQWASGKLRSDRDFILHAVAHTGGALQYASEELRDDDRAWVAALLGS